MYAYAAASLQPRWYTGAKHTKEQNMYIKLPEDVDYIITRLTEYGYEAYAVGGCVRDSIICRVPGDWDITTSAKPWEVKKLFRRTVDTGIEHGTVTVMMGNEGYEVTTYRIDGEYEDSRHPKNVEFTSNLREDLKRRDFTINAMAYNYSQGIVDMFDGKGDIERKIIRCVGNPEERFTEDALRMLRAVRFSAQLGYEIAEETADAVKKLAGTISKISKERIHTELNKILLSDHPDYLMKAMELGITEIVFSALNDLPDKETAMKLLIRLPKELVYRYGAVLFELGKKRTVAVLRELKLDNNTIDNTGRLVDMHGMEITEDKPLIRHQASSCGAAMYEMVLRFEYEFYMAADDRDKAMALKKQEALFKEILENGDCLTLKELAVTGNDLIEAGIHPGKEIGNILRSMLDDVLNTPEHNAKKYLFDNHLHI